MDLLKTIALILGISLLMVYGLNLFPIIIFVFPLAFIVIGVRFSLRDSFLGILMAALLVVIILDPATGVALFAVFGPMSLFIAHGIRTRKKLSEIIIPSSIIVFLSIILSIVIISNISGINFIEEIEESMKMIVDLQMSMFEEVELTNIESIRLRQRAEELTNNFVLTLPSIFIIISVITSYINYYFSVLILRRMGLGIRDNPAFSKFSLPNNFVIGTLAMFLITYLLRNFESSHYHVLYLNLIVLIISLLMIQGLAVFNHLLLKRFKIIPIVRGLMIAISIFISPIVMVFIFIGMMDLIFDFRKLRRRKV